MSMWLARAGAQGNSDYLFLPLPPEGEQWPALAGVHSAADIRKRMQAIAPLVPPESFTTASERIWRFMREMAVEDIVMFADAQSGQARFAEISGPLTKAEDAQGNMRYAWPLAWRNDTAPLKKFRAFKEALDAVQQWPRPVHDPKFRVLIRDALKLPGSRFAQWKWILAVLITLKLIIFAINLWKRETAGF